MAIFEQNADVNSLIKITNGGIQVASFADIRDTLIKQMKKIYGNDIDTSSATADGQWINSIALILNNMCQVIHHSYEMLDPSSATGAFLDILCSYNNISRTGLTASKAQLLVKNVSGVAQPNVKAIQFIDKEGKLWIWKNPGVDQSSGEIISKNKVIAWTAKGDDSIQTLTDVECDTMGAIIAPGTGVDIDELTDGTHTGWDALQVGVNDGWINQSLEYGKWKVYQEYDAEVGTDEESDESLRSRRIQSLGNQSVSVLSGLEGTLLNLSGIKDVWIYDNKSSSSTVVTMDDGTEIPQHAVYICIRYADNATIDKSIIGNIIYNKLTPGIPTISFDDDDTDNPDGYYTGKNINYQINKSSQITYNLYWKKCLPYEFKSTTDITTAGTAGSKVACWMAVKINLIMNAFDIATNKEDGSLHHAITDVEKNIVTKVLNYLNNISLGEDLNGASLLSAVQNGDISKNGVSTFFALESIVTGATNSILNLKNTYMSFTSNNIFFSTPTANAVYSTGFVIIKASS